MYKEKREEIWRSLMTNTTQQQRKINIKFCVIANYISFIIKQNRESTEGHSSSRKDAAELMIETSLGDFIWY